MFKVECLGCQAPYQVDERRVPEKGLKMRCPKCGTSFRVEPPSRGQPSAPIAVAPFQVAHSATEVPPLFASAPAAGASSAQSKPAGKGGLGRTMIGVSAAELDALSSPPAPSAARAPFRIPRPSASDRDMPALGGEGSAERLALGKAGAETSVDELDAALPAVLGAPRGAPPVAWSESEAEPPPASAGTEALSEAPPESLIEPSTPLSLSELPPPVAGAGHGPPPVDSAAPVANRPLELDLEDELPVVAPPGRRPPPPPRRVRQPPAPEAPDARAGAEEALDLPARIEDLELGFPNLGGGPARGRAGGQTASSSLDELDLPATLQRSPARPQAELELDLPSAAPPLAEQAADGVDYPALRRPAAPQPHRAASGDLPARREEAGLPAVAAADLPAASHAELPAIFHDELPDVLGAALPAAASAGLPAIASAGLPQVATVGLPGVSAAGLPAVVAAELPDVASAALPDVLQAGLPIVGGAGLPQPVRADLPSSSATGLPEVSGRGVAGFGRVDLPVAREASLPEVKGLVEVDLPGVGESLPSIADHDAAQLPIVGESLPAAKGARRSHGAGLSEGFEGDADPFGLDGDGDPFGAAEADFDVGGVDDPFGVRGDADGDGGGRELRSPGASYGEVDIDDGTAPALETADDMEFSAIPEQPSTPLGRAAASAAVHETADVEANGSTLELGPERRAPRRVRSKAMVVAAVACVGVIAGGALALEPSLGPFGAHFIMDRLERGQHEQVLARWIDESRKGMAQDSFEASRAALGGIEAARDQAPRFEPLHAWYAFLNFDLALRFGPLPKLEAAGKAALSLLDAQSPAPAHRLARAAHAAASRAPDAKAQLEALGGDPEARQLLGTWALAARHFEMAQAIWKELHEQQPANARAAFGLGQAALGLGDSSAARSAAERALQINPAHVGAQILLIEVRRAASRGSTKERTEALDSEALLAAISRVLPKAAPGEAALAHSVAGEIHLAQGRSGPARQAFEEALAIDRNFPRALVGLGETLHLAGRHTEALARFEAAAAAEPGALAAELGIAKSQIHLTRLPEAKATLERLKAKHEGNPEIIYWLARAEEAIGSNEAALLGYRAAIDAGKGRADSVNAYLALARLQADLGQLSEAQRTLSEASEKLPPSGELHKALGEIALNRAQYAEAYAEFQRAENLDAGDTRARFLGAVALTRLGRFDDALAAFQRVSESDKEFPGLAVERGRLFEESGRVQEAVREYEAALAASPEDLEVQVRVGCARVAAGQALQASELLEKVAKALPRSSEAAHCLGRALLDQGQHSEAIGRLERAVQLDPTRATYHLYAAWALADVGRHGDAEAALDRALALDEGLADALWQRGRLRLKQGAVKDAIKDLERALELKPARNEARADLAVAHADLGRVKRAASWWEEALAGDPDNATWHFRYGKLLSASGQSAQAAAHLRRAIDLAEPRAAVPGEPRPKAPVWLWQAHYLLARELGQVGAAAPHWQAYMRLSPKDDPYRPEAVRALEALGQPWEPR